MKRVLVCVLKFCVHVKSVCVYLFVCVKKAIGWKCVLKHTLLIQTCTLFMCTHTFNQGIR